ncbi:hypothetical protein STSP2_00008 [Anaerohalosphaera lusitana]|uniref:Uncharacterized protein n=1 Tax=Anaerohalosphaera lusitana TaxID=1936003 RepID=A0A1U9NGZ2_9BACT|nr:hypothetical protein STSP2_00008 [Anaerohalosphaera lusitana]
MNAFDLISVFLYVQFLVLFILSLKCKPPEGKHAKLLVKMAWFLIAGTVILLIQSLFRLF